MSMTYPRYVTLHITYTPSNLGGGGMESTWRWLTAGNARGLCWGGPVPRTASVHACRLPHFFCCCEQLRHSIEGRVGSPQGFRGLGPSRREGAAEQGSPHWWSGGRERAALAVFLFPHEPMGCCCPYPGWVSPQLTIFESILTVALRCAPLQSPR